MSEFVLTILDTFVHISLVTGKYLQIKAKLIKIIVLID